MEKKEKKEKKDPQMDQSHLVPLMKKVHIRIWWSLGFGLPCYDGHMLSVQQGGINQTLEIKKDKEPFGEKLSITCEIISK